MLTWTTVDFPHTFIVILPLIPRTLNNSNLPFTQFNSCFPSNNFYIIWPSKTWTMFKCVASRKKIKTVYYRREVRSTEIISKQPWQFFIQLFCPFRYRLGSVYKEMYKKCCTVWSPLGVNSSISHTHGLPEAFSFNFPTRNPCQFFPPRELSGLN